MNEKDIKTRMVGAFVSLVNASTVADLPDVIDTVCNCFSNAIGLAIVRKLQENCDCDECRKTAKRVLDEIFKQIIKSTFQSIDLNLIYNDLEPLLEQKPDHNAQVAEEIQREIEQTENKG